MSESPVPKLSFETGFRNQELTEKKSSFASGGYKLGVKGSPKEKFKSAPKVYSFADEASPKDKMNSVSGKLYSFGETIK
jgi:hypothetical protein